MSSSLSQCSVLIVMFVHVTVTVLYEWWRVCRLLGRRSLPVTVTVLYEWWSVCRLLGRRSLFMKLNGNLVSKYVMSFISIVYCWFYITVHYITLRVILSGLSKRLWNHCCTWCIQLETKNSNEMIRKREKFWGGSGKNVGAELSTSFDLVQAVSSPCWQHLSWSSLAVTASRRLLCAVTRCHHRPSTHCLSVHVNTVHCSEGDLTWKKLNLEAFTASMCSSELCDYDSLVLMPVWCIPWCRLYKDFLQCVRIARNALLAMQSAVLARGILSVCPSFCPSIRHVPVLCQDEWI